MAPIVMIHVFSEAIDWWDEIAPTLAKDHRVVRIDLTGHGGTEAPESGYTMEQQAAMVVAMLDKLGIDRFTLIAHSMGGIVSTAFIQAHPRQSRAPGVDRHAAEGRDHLQSWYAASAHPVIGELLMRLNTNSSIRKQMEEVFTPASPVPEQFVEDFRQVTYIAFRDSHDDNVIFQHGEARVRAARRTQNLRRRCSSSTAPRMGSWPRRVSSFMPRCQAPELKRSRMLDTGSWSSSRPRCLS